MQPSDDCPVVLAHIVHSLIAPFVKRRFFGKAYVPFVAYGTCYGQAFQDGAVLGYAYRNSILSFAELLCAPGHEAEIISFLQQRARELLTTHSENPESLLRLGSDAELSRIKANWRESGITEPEIKNLLFSYKMPIESVVKNITVAVSTGIGLGSAFPELTERLWELDNERLLNQANWERAKACGLIAPDEPRRVLTIAQKQEELLGKLRMLVAQIRPELLGKL